MATVGDYRIPCTFQNARISDACDIQHGIPDRYETTNTYFMYIEVHYTFLLASFTLLPTRLNSCHMIRDQQLPVIRAVVDRVAIIVRLSPAELLSKLPVHITRNTLRRERRLLPGDLDLMVGCPSILLEDARLACSLADAAVLLDPVDGPAGLVDAPALRVHVEGAEVERLDGKVGGEVDALALLVGVRAVARAGVEALVAERDQVRAVERLDVRAGFAGPLGDDLGAAAVAARLIGELPREDRGAVLVAADDGLDVVPVLRLGCGVGVPGGLAAAVVFDVGVDSAIVVPVVHKVDDDLDAMGLGRGDNIV